MRNLETSGGLAHGSGMTELRQNIWTVSTPVSAEVHNALQESSGLEKKTGEQNVDMSVAKMSQDWKDTNTVYEFLDELCVISPMEFMLKQQLTLTMQGILATHFLKTWPELLSLLYVASKLMEEVFR